MSRITNIAMSTSADRNLQAAMGRLAAIQEKASSQREITRPSDDPSGTSNAMLVRAEQRANQQFARNVQDAQGWLSTVDSSLGATTELLQRMRDLTLLGANDGAMGPDAKEAIALELDQIHDALLTQANTKFMGRSVFAGTSDAAAAVDDDYNFSATGSVDRRIGPNSTVRVDADGAKAFGQGQSESIFALVKTIAAELRDGTNVGFRVGDIDERLKAVNGVRATNGASHAAALTAEWALLTDSVELEGRRSKIEDIDLGLVALELKSQELGYQAALSAAARTLQPSLMDFLR
ncbi:flagellar hook-associated protein FlgL [Paeniglutamicibacter cryotolerans]|uniref:Flagellar hook-associated protein 3 FlgL n=1 Tax=Paeniglutamicibacter cryotolerans TaxID=670079 RepID=A0A839QCR0_9MICC|nr:flagellar hook-associated protein FlgL [Paeniglutamicibacter cryotolerans]MBB2993909.1 flagellar hook-associated protein 3 FlgL [Paeniglutamicibacter cryotolerans]